MSSKLDALVEFYSPIFFFTKQNETTTSGALGWILTKWDDMARLTTKALERLQRSFEVPPELALEQQREWIRSLDARKGTLIGLYHRAAHVVRPTFISKATTINVTTEERKDLRSYLREYYQWTGHNNLEAIRSPTYILLSLLILCLVCFIMYISITRR